MSSKSRILLSLYQRGLPAYCSSTEEGLRSAIERFDRVNELDPTFAPAFAISKIEEAIALNLNDAMSHHYLGWALKFSGRSKEAIPHIDHAMRLSPRDIFLTGMMTDRAFALFDLEQYEEALEWVRRARLSPNPRSMTFALLTAVLTRLEHTEEAEAALADLLAHAPEMLCAKYRENPITGPEVMERFVDALSEAGLPE